MLFMAAICTIKKIPLLDRLTDKSGNIVKASLGAEQKLGCIWLKLEVLKEESCWVARSLKWNCPIQPTDHCTCDVPTAFENTETQKDKR